MGRDLAHPSLWNLRLRPEGIISSGFRVRLMSAFGRTATQRVACHKAGNAPIAAMGNPGHIRQMAQARLYPELHALSGQFGEDLSALTPVSGSFCHTLRAEIGIRGERGSDAFDFDVCSPQWLEGELESHPILPGGPRLIAKKFDPAAVEEHVRKRLRHASGPDWATVAAKIGQWSRWEFENHEG